MTRMSTLSDILGKNVVYPGTMGVSLMEISDSVMIAMSGFMLCIDEVTVRNLAPPNPCVFHTRMEHAWIGGGPTASAVVAAFEVLDWFRTVLFLA